MKFDQRTIQILKSFSTINQSIAINPGKVIKTISPSKTVIAEAMVDFEFDRPFAIYDLGRFLGVMSLFKDPELTVDEKNVHIVDEAGAKTSYVLTDPSNLVTVPTKDLKIPDTKIIEFDLKEADVQKVQKALAVLSLPEIQFYGDGENVFIQAVDTKNPTGDVFSTPIGTTDQSFKAIFKSENIRLMPGDYHVRCAKEGISEWTSEGLRYFIAMEGTSKFD